MHRNVALSNNQRGEINTLLIPLVLITLLLLAVGGFAGWSFTSRQQYKDHTDSIVATQVEIAKKETATAKDNEFTEKEKQPFKNYQASSSLGSLLIKYPKTWSAYIEESGSGGTSLDGYFHPVSVPGTRSGTAYALRVQVVDKSFSDEVRTYESQIKSGKAKASSYNNKNIAGVVGMRIDGEIKNKQQGIIVLMPLRDKTIKLSTESDQFYNDFNNNILPNFSFTP